MKALVLAVALGAAAGWAAPASAQAPLAVPYLPQTEALCGGAAAAMVMRFWGATGVYADAFAPLVDRAAGGIHTSALTGALEARGWRAEASGGNLAQLSQAIAHGRPVIALIEDRPGRFHYVVVVAASAERVTLHDPARAPDRTMDAAAFDRKWHKSDRWMLVVLPGTATATPNATADTSADSTAVAGTPSACQARVDEGVGAAQSGDTVRARRLLDEATRQCPRDAAGWRELAGLDALDRQWDAAAAHAAQAVERDPRDEYAWRLLATARYLQHADLDALTAWNRVGEPRVDLVAITGLAHTRYLVVADAIGVQPRDVLTADALRLAEKRVRNIPAIATARVTFHPLERGEAQVDAAVVERPRAPRSYVSLLALGGGALTNHELAASFANVSGGGDVVDVAWRWWEHRPRVGAVYSAPGPWGVWRLEAFRETQTFGVAPIAETRSRIAGEISNWVTDRVRLTGGVALDRWRGRGRAPSASAQVQFWPIVDRVAVEAGGAGWRGAGEPFGTASLRLRARSRSGQTGTVVLGDAGYQFASASAPLSLWPGADTGHARDVQLRAHPLLDEGIINDGVFGRTLAFGSAEIQRWLATGPVRMLRIAPAAFVDVGRARRGLAASNAAIQYDAGVGIRVSLPGAGVLRMDIARGLSDGATALSFGWQR